MRRSCEVALRGIRSQGSQALQLGGRHGSDLRRGRRLRRRPALGERRGIRGAGRARGRVQERLLKDSENVETDDRGAPVGRPLRSVPVRGGPLATRRRQLDKDITSPVAGVQRGGFQEGPAHEALDEGRRPIAPEGQVITCREIPRRPSSWGNKASLPQASQDPPPSFTSPSCYLGAASPSMAEACGGRHQRPRCNIRL